MLNTRERLGLPPAVAVIATCVILLFSLPAIAFAADGAPIVIPSAAEPDTPIACAEHLFALAQQGKLDNQLADNATALLDHSDPFVAGIAEWAIATKVNEENNGERIVWPQADPPAWYRKWMDLEDEFLMRADYVRQGAVWGIHHDARSMCGSLKLIIARATAAAREARRVNENFEAEGRSGDCLARLHQLRIEMDKLAISTDLDLTQLRKLWLTARLTARSIVMANPAVRFDELVFITRHPALFANITGSQYPWSHKPGGDICIREGLEPDADCLELIDGRLGPGHAHGIDLWWEADRVVFGWASQPDWPPPWDTISGDNVFQLRGHQTPTHLYEIDLKDGSLQQLTEHSYWSDFEPTYCADGSIVFASDRSGRSSECGKFSADHTVINLYRRCRQSGAIRRLNDNKDIDRYPHSLDNGLIGYTRWEYQERHFMETHAVWTVRPDGTMADAVFNQHLAAPYALRDVRSVPGSNRLVAVATGHHTFAYGPVVVVDPSRGTSSEEAIEIITPRVKPQEGPMAGRPIASGGPPDRCGIYQTPWALSETCFLTAYSYSNSKTANGFAIYLVDAFGNKELLHRDQIYSCSFPLPLQQRPRPPVLPVHPSVESSQATCYLSDVYQGLDDVPRGTARFLRISQRVGWPLDEKIGAMRYIPGNAWEKQFGHWNWAPVRVIGEVPIQADGSAHFLVPADSGIYFQLLDANHMEIRRMRSHVTLQPGEVRGCVGCHETRAAAPPTTWRSSIALQQPPRRPNPPPWGADRLLGYESLIQPILDRYCIRCHGVQEPAGGLAFTGLKAESEFVQSFHTLFGRPSQGHGKLPTLVSIVDRLSDSSVTAPKQAGSHRSRLIEVLLDDELHQDEVQMTPDDWLALVTWIDANAPYHDRFYNRRRDDGDAPRREVEINLTDPFLVH